MKHSDPFGQNSQDGDPLGSFGWFWLWPETFAGFLGERMSGSPPDDLYSGKTLGARELLGATPLDQWSGKSVRVHRLIRHIRNGLFFFFTTY